MSTDLGDLLTALAELPAPLPAGQVAALLAAARRLPSLALRVALMGRAEVSHADARALAASVSDTGVPVHLQYLTRPDTPATDVLAAVPLMLAFEACQAIASLTDPGVLAELAHTSTDRFVLMQIVLNPATPTPDAVHATDAAIAASGSDYVRTDAFRWVGAHVPDAVLDAWVAQTSNVGALAEVVGRRRGGTAALERLVTLAVAAVPAGAAVEDHPEAFQALQRAAVVSRDDCELPVRYAQMLRDAGVRSKIGDAAVAVGFADAPPGYRKPAADRAWRSLRKAVGESNLTKAETLALLTERLGTNEDAWTVLHRCAPHHSGTLGDLVDVAAAVAAPAAAQLPAATR